MLLSLKNKAGAVTPDFNPTNPPKRIPNNHVLKLTAPIESFLFKRPAALGINVFPLATNTFKSLSNCCPDINSFGALWCNKSKEINKALVIGGSIPRNENNIFQSDREIATILKKSGITVDCGIYPQNETEIEILEKLKIFENAITQMCMDTKAINNLPLLSNIRIGIPSMCSVKGIYKYLKLCGNDSYKYIFKNWKAINYMSNDGIKVDNFIQELKFSNYHIYNFGNLDKTIHNLLKSL